MKYNYSKWKIEIQKNTEKYKRPKRKKKKVPNKQFFIRSNGMLFSQ